MRTDTDPAAGTERILGRYEAGGNERHIVAISPPDEVTFRILDVLAEPRRGDGDVDQRQVEERVRTLAEAEAIAVDYIRLAERLGWTPMPGGWW